MQRALITLFSTLALGWGAAVALADSVPIGSLPAGPVATIEVQHGELVALALPRRNVGRVWRVAPAGQRKRATRGLRGECRFVGRSRVPRSGYRSRDSGVRADEGRYIREGARVAALPSTRSLTIVIARGEPFGWP
jgi:hypothetical protein